MIQHLVTLIQHEALNVAEAKLLVANKGVKTTRGGDNDVRVGIFAGEELDILLHGCASVEDCGLDFGHVLAEAGVLVLDLVCEFASVAHDKNGGLAGNRFYLLQGGQDEDCSLSETGLGLAEDVGTKDGLRNADLLDWIAHVMSEWFGKM